MKTMRASLILSLLATSNACSNSDTNVSPSVTAFIPLEGVVLEPLAGQSDSTTPQAIELRLVNADVDAVRIHGYISDINGVAKTTCQVAEVYRIGPKATDWQQGAVLTVPLGYDEQLPDGTYIHRIHFQRAEHTLDVPSVETADIQRFQVIDGGIRVSANAQPAAVTRTMSPNDVALVDDPCPAFAAYSDGSGSYGTHRIFVT